MRKHLAVITALILTVSMTTGMAWGFGGEPGEEIRPNIVQEFQPTPSAPAPTDWVAQEEPPVVDYQPSGPAPEMAPAPAAPGAKCTQTCYRPVMKTREVVCRRPVCKYREETRTCKVPVYTRETRTRNVTCWKTELETITRQVQSCTTQVDECGCVHCVPTICEVPCQVPRQVPYTVEQEYSVVVCNWETKEYTVKVPYQDWEEFTCTQQFCEWEPYEVEVCCPVCTCAPCCCAF
jgi:hypothetical protein